MLKRLEQLESALVLLAADNNSIKSLYPNENDWIIIRVNIDICNIFFLKKKILI
jgi:hypothetical protein